MYNPTIKPGFLEVIAGPMYSGKTLELVNRLRKIQYMQDATFVVLKTAEHLRDDPNILFMRGLGDTFSCELIHEPSDIYEKGTGNQVVIIDEAHFLSTDAIEPILKLQKERSNVIVAGLDLDFYGKPFPVMAKLFSYANSVKKLSAICMKSKNEPGTRTQLLINGEPVRSGMDTVNHPEDKEKLDEKWEVRSIWNHEI